MRRFFIPFANVIDGTALITDSDAHQILHVLRKKVGDVISATDGTGGMLTARIKGAAEGMVTLEILKTEKVEERSVQVRLFQAIPRGGRLDVIIEKACELGVSELVPVVTERTVSQPDKERGLKKRARWEKIALEAMKQVGRASSMAIRPVVPLNGIGGMLDWRQDADVLACTGGAKAPDHFSLKILFWELEQTKTLRALLKEKKGVKNIDVIIGPEGGFSAKEVDWLLGGGFESVSLGKRVLKVETAAIAALSNIYYELEG